MLEVNQLSYRYPSALRNALTDISFRLPQGQCIGLLGANGSGKSTLLSLVAQLIEPSRGQLNWQQPPSVGLVPQSLAFYPKLSVLENLQLFADLYRLKGALRQQQLEFAIEAAQLETLVSKPSAQLSGGQQRRLNFALGMLTPAQLYLLDEVTVGVDSISRQHQLTAIEQLKQNGKSILYTSHYLPEIEQLADRVILLNEGAIQQDLYLAEQPSAHSLVVEWAEPVPSALLRVCQQLQLHTQHQHTRLLVPELAPSQWAQLLSHIHQIQPAPVLLHYRRPSLEQLYHALNAGQS